jgi:hypothetical protein
VPGRELRRATLLDMSDQEQPDWLAELAKGGEAVQRAAAELVESARQFAATPGQPFTRRLVRAANAALGELFPAAPADVNVAWPPGRFTLHAYATSVIVGGVVMTGTGSMAGVTFPAPTITATVTAPAPDEVRIGEIVAYILLAFSAGACWRYGQRTRRRSAITCRS